ncbi:hypothetical protein MJO28_006697 [Puccinia striiformis f. sp. tritici]|uniref:Uncharacterized protein n=1 Tax=Puccinia striiformis f. sp. tritici TaxID=168172 RepID=A0ACC0EIL5_9BASI|nr:hypothetical protein MJO28_006697 [Puccinia striiformis f. sp. tritici]
MEHCECAKCLAQLPGGNFLAKRTKQAHLKAQQKPCGAEVPPDPSFDQLSILHGHPSTTLNPANSTGDKLETQSSDSGKSAPAFRGNQDAVIIMQQVIWKLLHLVQKISMEQFSIIKQKKDTRTVIKHFDLTPIIVQHVSCPICFSLYLQTKQVPENSTHQETPTSKACGEPLFMSSVTFQGLSDKGIAPRQTKRFNPRHLSSVQVPRSFYHCQLLEGWLKWFLARPKTKKGITGWARTVWDSRKFHDIQQSPAWRHLTQFHNQEGSSLNLVFSVFIDWFNPYGNKTAGKKYPMGIIAMNCLNSLPTYRS